MTALPKISIPPVIPVSDDLAATSMAQPASGLSTALSIPSSNPVGHDVVNTGWDIDKDEVDLLIDGISNKEIWMLVRRLNKVVFSVKETSRASPDGLDLIASPEQDFSPNNMRAQLERLYMGMLIGTLAFIKHVSRLRSWNEKTRTGVFCVVRLAMPMSMICQLIEHRSTSLCGR